MTSNMQRIILGVLLLVVLNYLALQSEAYPATTSTEATTHIVSYVNQRKSQKNNQQKAGQHDEFHEFDFENFRSNLTAKEHPEMRGALQQLVGRFVENFETNLDNLATVIPRNGNYKENVKFNEITYSQSSDDLMENQENTLENGFGQNEQHESPKNDTMWQRSKQSIPVLEPVKHLLNSVRNGHLNHTEHVQRHRTLLSENGDHNVSMAIETEEEREMANGSQDLQFLEVLGTIGSKLWGFLANLRQVFAASSASASAALSSSSSSSSS